MKANTLNPQTGEFEMLTTLEWRKLSVGLAKDADVSDAMIAIFGGPNHCVRHCFRHRKINQWDTPIENGWLLKRYSEWFPKKPSSEKDLLGWGRFIEDMYNLDVLLPMIRKLGMATVNLMQTKLEREHLNRRLTEINHRDFDYERTRRKRAADKDKNS